jgi:serine/threonine-protein kinase RsbW
VVSSSVRAPVSLRLPFAASSVAVARQRLKDWMTEHEGPHDAVEDARVVISELVANAVRHARPMADSGVELAVTDGGSPTRPHHVQAPPTATAGRGMAIVETLAHEWWTERTPSRTTVHARIRG